jgi:hypothetical protein
MTTSDPSVPTPEPAAPTHRSLLSVFLGMLVRPGSTLAYLRDHGGLTWLVPLALLLALTLVSRAVAIPIERKQMEEALAKLQQQMSEGTKDDTFVFSGPGIGGPRGTPDEAQASIPMLDYGLPLGSALFDWAARGLVLFGFAWLLGGRPAPGTMLRMNGWTLIPSITHLLVAIAIMLASGRVPTSGLGAAPPGSALETGGSGALSGPGVRFEVAVGPKDAEGQPEFVRPSFAQILWGNFLQTIDVYRIWELALLVVGVAVTARLGWLKALVPPLAYWVLLVVLATLPIVLMPLLGPLLFGGPTIVR